VEVLVLRYNEVFLVLDEEHCSELGTSEISQFIPPSDIFYPSVPVQQRLCYLPAEKLEAFYPMVAEAHQVFIALAAKRRKKSAWQASFSPGVISYLNHLLSISLPVPSYFSGTLESETIFPDEITTPDVFREGAVSQVLVNVYERAPDARKICIEHYGLNCHVCDFNFEAVYGERGTGFIHVHHLRLVSGGESEVNPIDDLRPVCPNCHAMIHRYGLLSIEELKELIKNTAVNGTKTA
jgi:5-methylcytosine-specific restriction enzyme A